MMAAIRVVRFNTEGPEYIVPVAIGSVISIYVATFSCNAKGYH